MGGHDDLQAVAQLQSKCYFSKFKGQLISVADPDPDPVGSGLFGSPGSGSGSGKKIYGSGSGSGFFIHNNI